MPNLVIYIPKDLERRLQEAREDWKEHARVVAVEALREAAVTERGQRLPLAQRDGAQGNPASSVRSPRSVTAADVYHAEVAGVTERVWAPYSRGVEVGIGSDTRSVTPAEVYHAEAARLMAPARTQMCEHRIPATHFCRRCDS